MMPTPLTLDDVPHFAVSAARKGETRENGETDYRLSGTFDRTKGECSLLLPQGDVLIALTGDLRFVEISAGTALYETAEQSMPEVVGLKLTYLDRRWEPYHVWMVADPRWKWNKVLFQAVDATARKVVAGRHSLKVVGTTFTVNFATPTSMRESTDMWIWASIGCARPALRGT